MPFRLKQYLLLQIVFKATPSKNYTSRIALDSFILADGLCDDENELDSSQQGFQLVSIIYDHYCLYISTKLIVASDICDVLNADHRF